ncbi:MAG TPA: divalent metal cation transporter [Gemmatimonadetes bacterium]|jgi:Mn2+/Fe2+ NRAMP family transporter|nr:divalent metal cation transporter [Gemmatimonadota bacterium]
MNADDSYSNSRPQDSGTDFQAFLKSFGPGLLWAGSAIGVSHLVQSTRAGGEAGFALAGVIFFALALKYPFFEYGPRYASATGESLVEGYRRIGKWAVWLFFFLAVFTVVITNAAIILFTSSLLQYTLGTQVDPVLASALVYTGCAVLLRIGYSALDIVIKVVLLTLAISTLIAAVVVAPQTDFSTFSMKLIPPPGSTVTLAFMLALAGWMPSDILISLYSSLWTLAKNQASGITASVATSRLDFKIAYFGTALLAFAFLTLGAGVMYKSGTEFSSNGAVFSTQLIDLYVQTLGPWTKPIMMITALTAMLSTALTVADGYPRVLDRAVKVLTIDDPEKTANAPVSRPYWIAVILIGIAMTTVLQLFQTSMTQLVDFVTIVAFLTGPIIGFLNLKAITSPVVPEEHRPGKAMRMYSYAGLIAMTSVAIIFIVSRLG